MKTPSKTLKLSLLAISLGLIGTACNEQSSVNEISESDLAMAAEIMSSSLSDQADGVLASVYDATATVSKDGLAYGPQVSLKGQSGPIGPNDGSGASCDSSSRGTARNTNYSYDPETGIHTISMERNITTRQFTKSMSMMLKHQFTHESGAFVVLPRENRDSVNTIYFTSEKSGSESGEKREGQFSKVDTLSMTGLAEAAETLILSGTHVGSGSSKFTLKTGESFEKNHDVYIKLTNVTVDKATVQANQNLEQGITGTIEYRIVTYNSKLSDEETVIEGTIEMTGDGTALMNFKGFGQKAIIDLMSGDTSIE